MGDEVVVSRGGAEVVSRQAVSHTEADDGIQRGRGYSDAHPLSSTTSPHTPTCHSVQSCLWHFLDTATELILRVRLARNRPPILRISEATSQCRFTPTSGTIAISGQLAATTQAYSPEPRYRRSVPPLLPSEVHATRNLVRLSKIPSCPSYQYFPSDPSPPTPPPQAAAAHRMSSRVSLPAYQHCPCHHERYRHHHRDPRSDRFFPLSHSPWPNNNKRNKISIFLIERSGKIAREDLRCPFLLDRPQ